MTLPVHNRARLQRWALSTLFTALSTAAVAAPVTYGNITLDASYTLDGGSTVDGMSSPSGSVYTTANGADLSLYDSSGTTGSSVFFHTYGFSDSPTYFGARASGNGVFTASTSASYAQSFTNTSGTAQNYQFSFAVADGELDIFGTGTGSADLLLQVSVNGVAIARDFTSVLYNSSGTTSCSTDDLGSLASYMGCASNTSTSSYSAGGLYTVDLGVIAAGDSFDLRYDIVTHLTGDFVSGSSCGGGDDGGGGEVPEPNIATFAVIEVGESCLGGAVARSGDPFTPTSFNVSTVPEPGSLALLGLGIAGLATARRRRAAR